MSLSPRRVTKAVLAALKRENAGIVYDRPRTRGDCVDGIRPCPYVGCKYHLAIDVHPTRGTIKFNMPQTELEDMPETCCLDVADRGAHTLEEVGRLMNLTRERVRQVEELAADAIRGDLEGAREDLCE